MKILTWEFKTTSTLSKSKPSYDEKGRKTAVIVPLSLWEKMKKRKRLKETFDPSEYRGIYRGLGIDLEEEIRSLREEWTRDT